MKAAIAILFILQFPHAATPGSAKEMQEEFGRYSVKPVASSTVNAVQIARKGPDETLSAFGRRIRREAGKQPNFAGKYSLVLWSCGFICSGGAIVDVKTRELHWLPFITAGQCVSVPGTLVDFRPDSRLLIVRGQIGTPNPSGPTYTESDCGIFKFEWTGGRFQQIQAAPQK
jgi:hypothetical protein